MNKLSAIEIKKETPKVIKQLKEAKIFLTLENELPPDILEIVRKMSKKKSMNLQ